MKSSVELKWTPFLSLLKKEVSRFLKVAGQTVATPLINSTLYLLIFGVSLGQNIDLVSGVSYMAFLIPGLVTMAILNNSFQNSSSSILGSKFYGDIHDLKVVPLTNHQIIWAFAIAALIRGALVGVITLLVSEIFFWVTQGTLLTIIHPVWFVFFLALGGLSFGFMGISAGFWAKSFDQLNAISGFVLLPLIYLGGVFYSIQNLHPFWQLFSKVNPLFYIVNGVRYCLIGQSDIDFTKSIIVSILGTVILYAVAYRRVSRGSFIRW